MEVGLKEYIKIYWPVMVFSGLIVLLDQFTKNLVRTQLAPGEAWYPWDWIAPFVMIIHMQNSGVAFGMFQGAGVVFAVVAFVVSLYLLYFYRQVNHQDQFVRVAIIFLLGGSIGNLIDRILIGQVTDFLYLRNFAVINLADASITVGAAVLILGVYLQNRREKEDSASTPLLSLLL